jgi:hypothetical protein
VRALDDLTSDALCVCLARLEQEGRSPHDRVWVTVDAILDARGVKRIQKAGEPGNWQHGHRAQDRAGVGRALAQLGDLWIKLVEVQAIPERPRGRGRPRATALTLESRVLVVTDRQLQRHLDGGQSLVAARVAFGEWAAAYWELGLRQVATLTRRALGYDPYRQFAEKRLAKYLAFQFRFDAKNRRPRLRRGIDHLLTESGITADARNPERTRRRLEQALTRLRDDGLIGGWGYCIDIGGLPPRRWLGAWQESEVWIEPPAEPAAPTAPAEALDEPDGRRAGLPSPETPSAGAGSPR